MIIDHSLLRFAKILAGHFSNKEQALNQPKHFAHINIYFLPIPWGIMQGPGFYSEQSFDYAPWSPYRQGLHRLKRYEDIFVVENYELSDPIRFAGAGLDKRILEQNKPKPHHQRLGCSMHFLEIDNERFLGKVEPGNQCFIYREEKKTYLVSEVEIDKDKLISRDIGFDIETNELVWGSTEGPICLKRQSNQKNKIDMEWIESAY